MKELSIAILGFGGRGSSFAKMMNNPMFFAKVVAVAEPNPVRRNDAVRICGLKEDQLFETAEELLAQPRLADAIINTTMDHLHAQTAIPAMKKGYHVLLEKPMAVTPEDCGAIERTQRETGVVVAVCHSLRYLTIYDTIKKMIQRGDLGEIASFDQMEGVGDVHYSSSYVRGHWANTKKNSFILMTKCCHDIDLFNYLTGKKCKRVSSFGALTYFTRKNMPVGAPEYCLDGCPAQNECRFHCAKIYLAEDAWRFVFAKKDDQSVKDYLKRGPYGRCVFQCDNDVMDHQVVSLEYEEGITGTFTMSCFGEHRQIRVQGTKGTLEGSVLKNEVFYRDLITRNESIVKMPPPQFAYHGGADALVMDSFFNAVRLEDPQAVLTTAQESLESHSIVFAAEKSRIEGRVVEL